MLKCRTIGVKCSGRVPCIIYSTSGRCSLCITGQHQRLTPYTLRINPSERGPLPDTPPADRYRELERLKAYQAERQAQILPLIREAAGLEIDLQLAELELAIARRRRDRGAELQAMAGNNSVPVNSTTVADAEATFARLKDQYDAVKGEQARRDRVLAQRYGIK